MRRKDLGKSRRTDTTGNSHRKTDEVAGKEKIMQSELNWSHREGWAGRYD